LVAAPLATASGDHDSIGLPRPNSPLSKAGAFFSPKLKGKPRIASQPPVAI
jgi:hypothetical protein